MLMGTGLLWQHLLHPLSLVCLLKSESNRRFYLVRKNEIKQGLRGPQLNEWPVAALRGWLVSLGPLSLEVLALGFCSPFF